MTTRSADITVWIPSGGSPKEVRLPLWRPALTAAEARRTVANTTLLENALTDAQIAFRTHNPVALAVAVRMLRARPELQWPMWITDAVLLALEGRSTPTSKVGRHAQRLTQWVDDAADYVRYRAVELLRRHGEKIPAVYAKASELLDVEAVGSGATAGDGGIEKAYRRVLKRTGGARRREWELRYAPRYYPDIVTLHLLAAIDTVDNNK
jgi:hypothetical protein